MGRLGICFILLSLQCPMHVGLLATIFPIVIVSWSYKYQPPWLPSLGKQGSSPPPRGFHASLTLARQLEHVKGESDLQVSERQWENVFPVHAHKLQ